MSGVGLMYGFMSLGWAGLLLMLLIFLIITEITVGVFGLVMVVIPYAIISRAASKHHKKKLRKSRGENINFDSNTRTSDEEVVL